MISRRSYLHHARFELFVWYGGLTLDPILVRIDRIDGISEDPRNFFRIADPHADQRKDAKLRIE